MHNEGKNQWKLTQMLELIDKDSKIFKYISYVQKSR